MSIAFARSVRALDHDRFRPSVVALFGAIFLMIAWSIWFVFAGISIVESSENVQIKRDGSLSVTFSSSAKTNLHPGLKATVSASAPTSDKAISYPAQVANVSLTSSTGAVVADVYLLSGPRLAADSRPKVDVEIERLSPAALVLRAVRRTNQ